MHVAILSLYNISEINESMVAVVYIYSQLPSELAAKVVTWKLSARDHQGTAMIDKACREETVEGHWTECAWIHTSRQ